MTIRIITPAAKLEFHHLIDKAPEDSEYDAGKWVAKVWVSKSDKEFKKKLENLMQEAITEKWGATPPAKVTLVSFEDGDTYSYTNAEGEEIFPNKGMYSFRVKTTHRPVIVDKTGSPITDKSVLGFTLQGSVKINCYTWSHGNKKGVSVGIDAAMLTDLGASGGIDGFEFQEAASA